MAMKYAKLRDLLSLAITGKLPLITTLKLTVVKLSFETDCITTHQPVSLYKLESWMLIAKTRLIQNGFAQKLV